MRVTIHHCPLFHRASKEIINVPEELELTAIIKMKIQNPSPSTNPTNPMINPAVAKPQPSMLFPLASISLRARTPKMMANIGPIRTIKRKGNRNEITLTTKEAIAIPEVRRGGT